MGRPRSDGHVQHARIPQRTVNEHSHVGAERRNEPAQTKAIPFVQSLQLKGRHPTGLFQGARMRTKTRLISLTIGPGWVGCISDV
jgi:hypothetical protein